MSAASVGGRVTNRGGGSRKLSAPSGRFKSAIVGWRRASDGCVMPDEPVAPPAAASPPSSSDVPAVAVAAAAAGSVSLATGGDSDPKPTASSSTDETRTGRQRTSRSLTASSDSSELPQELLLDMGLMDSQGSDSLNDSFTSMPPPLRHRTMTSPSEITHYDDSAPSTPRDSMPPGGGGASGSGTLTRSISETKLDAVSSDAQNTDSSTFSPRESAKVSKKESLRLQKKYYRIEKKKIAQAIITTLNDPSVEMLGNYLKVRTTLKSWIKLYCMLKPGLLVLYRSEKTNKSGQWVGTVLLNSCQLIERPSKKDGFCFKLFHPLEQSIWALKGPHGESTSLMGLNLPSGYLIFRALSDADGKTWMDHLELTMKIAPAKLKDSMLLENSDQEICQAEDFHEEDDLPDEEIEKRHFYDYHGEDDLNAGAGSETDGGGGGAPDPLASTSAGGVEKKGVGSTGTMVKQTCYVPAPPEKFGNLGTGKGLSEPVPQESKSLMFSVLRQLKPGMDLSKIVLPTFILEPRSFLDKLSDYYYHCDLMTNVVRDEDPFERMKSVVVFYLSGFYKKPQGLKKPYNPIIGEYFRCYWEHPTGTRTYYIAEQVSHHPPISVFHISNRAKGFAISGTILARSKFYGTSVAALFDGSAKLTLLSKGEDYVMNFPYAYAKGFLYGTVSMELGGKVYINCEKTGYSAEFEFKLKPYFGGKGSLNAIAGNIKLGKKDVAAIEGHWDGDIYFTDLRKENPTAELMWTASEKTVAKRLPRYIVDMNEQDDFESEKLWKKVEQAILVGDQQTATDEKFILEDMQRKEAKLRERTGEPVRPKFFKLDVMDERGFNYVYKHADFRPWDKDNDMLEYEVDGVIKTLSKHRIAPLIRTSSTSQVPPPAHRTGGGSATAYRTGSSATAHRMMSDDRYKSPLDTTPEGDESSPAEEETWTGVASESHQDSPGRRRMSKDSSVRSGGGGGRKPSSISESQAAAASANRSMAELVEENTRLLRCLQNELRDSRQQRSQLWWLFLLLLGATLALTVQSLYPAAAAANSTLSS